MLYRSAVKKKHSSQWRSKRSEASRGSSLGTCTHLFVKVPRPADSEGTFHLLLPV